MILILLSWCYILISSIIFGFLFNKLIATHSNNFAIKSIIGLFFITIISSVWALFFRINIEFHCILFSINCLALFLYHTEITSIFKQFYLDFKKLIPSLKIYLLLILFLILAQCATIPFIIDNESYYIQTIKWLNEYGFVPGLGNLHIFFAQTSGWHVLQSVFNFSFLYNNFNDISGFCLALGTIFATFKLNNYFRNSNKNYLSIGLLPLANLFFFQFINAPSPDIAVYILTLILFYYFIKFYHKTHIQVFNLLITLVLFILYIKPISVVLLLIPVSYFCINFKNFYKNIVPTMILSLSVLILFITKNTILTGFALYPFTNLNLNLDFQIPKDIILFMFKKSTRFSFFVSETDLQNLTNFQIFKRWFLVSKINFLFNLVTVVLFFVTPIFIYKFFNKKGIWIVYFISVLQLILLLFSIPQYRFFVHLSVFFGCLIISSFIKSKKIIIPFLFVSVIPIIILLFFQVQINSISSNKLTSKNSVISFDNVIFPYQNSKYLGKFEIITNGNLKYNSPVDNSFFWKTSNGNLPCVNKIQIKYFEKYFKIVPQMRTNNIKDGFYAKKVK